MDPDLISDATSTPLRERMENFLQRALIEIVPGTNVYKEFTKLIKELHDHEICQHEARVRADIVLKDHVVLQSRFNDDILPVFVPVENYVADHRIQLFLLAIEGAYPNDENRRLEIRNMLRNYLDGYLRVKDLTQKMEILMADRSHLLEEYYLIFPWARRFKASSEPNRFTAPMMISLAVALCFSVCAYYVVLYA